MPSLDPCCTTHAQAVFNAGAIELRQSYKGFDIPLLDPISEVYQLRQVGGTGLEPVCVRNSGLARSCHLGHPGVQSRR